MRFGFFGLSLTASAIVLYLAPFPAAAQIGASIQADSGSTNGGMRSTTTPPYSDGKPDLSGLWVVVGDAEGRTTKLLSRASDADKAKGEAAARARRTGDPNQPPYKPELLARVKYLSKHENEFDGILHCQMAGIPRMGPPQQIDQTPGQVLFLYGPAREASVKSGNYYRVIPIDGRPHHTDLEPSYLGDSVGHWEGATLVVDVVGFNDLTWLTSGGRFHSEAMHVIERFTRDGDTLKYEVTVEDPNVLTRPWTMTPRLLKLDPTAVIIESPPCVERDASHLVTNQHH